MTGQVPFADDPEHGLRFPRAQPSPEQIARLAVSFAKLSAQLQTLVASFAPVLVQFGETASKTIERFATEAQEILAETEAPAVREPEGLHLPLKLEENRG